MRTILTVLAVASAAVTGPTTSQEAMRPLQPLLGTWEGEGWMMRPGGREKFLSRETVTSRLGGAAVLIEGRHVRADNPEVVVHDAMGLVLWSGSDKTYRFRTQLATGEQGDYRMIITPGRFAWTLEAPGGGRIEYVATFDGKIWNETGKMSRDGQIWTPIFEMSLHKSG